MSAGNRLNWRKTVNAVMLTLTGVCTVLTVSSLFVILGYLLYNGGKSLDWNFFTKLPLSPGEEGGGMANAIKGSAVVVSLAALIGIPVGFLAGVYLSEYEDKAAHKWKVIATVVVPAGSKGVLTGMILGVARVAGETAPLIFTAFNNQFWSHGLRQPTATLPYQIYLRALSPYDDWHRQAWAAGLVLIALVLLANALARLVLARGISVPRG
jgi:ABC-type phosphate transport system permease subunit